MASIDKKDTLKNLKKKGFIDAGGDHNYLEFHYKGKLVLYTKISRGSDREINDYLIKQMYTQCKLDKKEFIDLAKCPLSKEKYLEILAKKNLLE
jgi:hypothetical protein